MKKTAFRTLIKEAIQHRISEIDKAGNDAAIAAKLSKIEEDSNIINKLKTSLDKPVFAKYIDDKILKAMNKDLENSLKELEKAKTKLSSTGKKKKVEPEPEEAEIAEEETEESTD